jgi:hypothetical protein
MPLLPSIQAPMHGAVVPIAYITLASAGSATFNNIPQGYQDLFIVSSVRTSNSSYVDGFNVALNGSTSSNNSATELWGDGSSPSSNRSSSTSVVFSRYAATAASATTGIFASVETHIFNYANTSTYKTILIKSAADSNGQGVTELAVGLVQSTSAVTSLTLSGKNASFIAGCTFALYGIRTVGQ